MMNHGLDALGGRCLAAQATQSHRLVLPPWRIIHIPPMGDLGTKQWVHQRVLCSAGTSAISRLLPAGMDTDFLTLCSGMCGADVAPSLGGRFWFIMISN